MDRTSPSGFSAWMLPCLCVLPFGEPLQLVSQVIPSYRATFELVAACVKGRCLAIEDVKPGRINTLNTKFL